MKRLTYRDIAFILAVEPETVELMMRDGRLEDPGSSGWCQEMVENFIKASRSDTAAAGLRALSAVVADKKRRAYSRQQRY